MKNQLLYFLLPLIFVFGSCKTSKTQEQKANTTTNSMTETKPHTKLIEMDKGACHGTCPIYKLTIYNDGIAEFNGKSFCTNLGPHTSKLSDMELSMLQQKVELLDMENYPEKIQSMIPDFPSTTITCYDADNSSKSVWWRNGAPDELNEMAVMLDKFREGLDWEVNTKAPLPQGTIENQLLIQLKDGVTASDFAKQYRQYNLIPTKELMPGKGYWLFELDTSKISGLEMLNLLNKSEQVHNAEFNKKLEQRQ